MKQPMCGVNVPPADKELSAKCSNAKTDPALKSDPSSRTTKPKESKSKSSKSSSKSSSSSSSSRPTFFITTDEPSSSSITSITSPVQKQKQKKEKQKRSSAPTRDSISPEPTSAASCFAFGGVDEDEDADQDDNWDTLSVGAGGSGISGGGAGIGTSTGVLREGVITSKSTTTVQQVQQQQQKKDKGGKGRFKKILRPLRRSHSAGSTKDVPPHALFLKHSDKKKASSDRCSLDQGGMEPVSSESEADLGDRRSTNTTPSTKPKKEKKSLAKDVKEKLSFLRRRHTDTNLSKDGKAAKPNVDTMLSWAKSFDTLLGDKYGLELFREFLQTEFSEENIEFWVSCEEFKSVPTDEVVLRAQEIYQDFVAVQAPREINLDSKTRLSTANNMSSPNRQTFEVAQKRIQALMEKDSYRRFLHSDVYLNLLGDQKYKLNLT